ncbi:MAG: protein kinase family protein, partial [archaeon]|nr:protein kinase family protein [archaeon]
MGQSTSRSVAALVNKSEPIFQLNEAIKTKNLTVVNELSSVWIDIIEVYRQPGTDDPAIHQALRLGWEDGVMMLLSGIGDSKIPSHVDQLGDNPVHLAIRGSFSKALNIFRGERKCFPWFNLKNTAGVTPNALLSVPTMPQNFPFPNHWISPDSLADIAPLSEGGYAKIFKAIQTKPDPSRPVVIKAIHMDSKQKAIPREATLLLSFPHPNIIDLLGVTHLPDRRIELALVLPFSPLGDVEQWMQANPESSLDVRFEIVLQIAQGLHHLHLHGVFHNDLKPQNVILFPHDDGQSLVAKLIDFGISYTDGAAFESTPVISPSTQQYCAPERSSFAARLQPENKPSAATDTYSFGQTAFFICRELRDSRFHPIWSKFLNSCTNDNPRLRPNSFQPLFVHAPPPPASFYWPDIWIPAEWVRKDDVPLSAGAQCEIYRGYLIDVFPDSSSPLIKQDAFPKSGSGIVSRSPRGPSCSSSLNCSASSDLPSGNTSQLASPSASNTFSFLLGASPSLDGVSSVGPSESGASCAKEIRVALKLVHTNQTHERPLLREISLLTRSGNKPHNIIPLYGATLLNNQICLITPLSEIGDLHTWLKHRLPILAKAETDPEPVKALDGLLVYIISGIARGVKSLHD